jgi:uncharacterized membrane protein AbrB (regulator of aidB expression)
VYWPVCIRNGGLAVLGYVMGMSFTPEAGRRIIQLLPPMMFVTLATILFSIMIAFSYIQENENKFAKQHYRQYSRSTLSNGCFG